MLHQVMLLSHVGYRLPLVDIDLWDKIPSGLLTWMNSLFCYINCNKNNKNNDGYTWKSLCSMVAKEAFKKLIMLAT